MFTEPQTVTVGGGAKSLARIGSPQPQRKGVFATADGVYTYNVSQDVTANRFRREVRLTSSKVAADPVSAVNKQVGASLIIVVDSPRWGFSAVELEDMYTGLVANLEAGTNANLKKLLGGEL